jgi:ATP-dependent Clp protease, protease subunit
MSIYRIKNKIYFHESITCESMDSLHKIIEEINDEIDKCNCGDYIQKIKPHPIYIHIETCGGDLQPSVYMYDIIKKNKYPIYTVVDNSCCSAGSIIFLAGKKRYMRKYSSIMIHAHIITFSDKNYNEMKNEIKNDDVIYNIMIDIYKANSNLSAKEIKTILKKDTYLYLDDCIVNGMINGEY